LLVKKKKKYHEYDYCLIDWGIHIEELVHEKWQIFASEICTFNLRNMSQVVSPCVTKRPSAIVSQMFENKNAVVIK
jgi:hypothetical protein